MSWDMIPGVRPGKRLAGLQRQPRLWPQHARRRACHDFTRSGLTSPGFTGRSLLWQRQPQARRPLRRHPQRQRLARLRRRHPVPGARLARSFRGPARQPVHQGRTRGRDQQLGRVSVLHGRSTLIGNGLVPSYRASGNAMLPGLYESNRGAVYTYPDKTENMVTQAALNGRHWFDEKTSAAVLAYVRTSRRDTTNGDVNPVYAAYTEDSRRRLQRRRQPAQSPAAATPGPKARRWIRRC
ncbi:hypothetical protein ACU4GD_10215 [Cupriavidus basilensis]